MLVLVLADVQCGAVQCGHTSPRGDLILVLGSVRLFHVVLGSEGSVGSVSRCAVRTYITKC